MAGEYTNITENGCSIVDYILAEPELFDVVDKFSILDVPETNHLPLMCKLNIQFQNTTALAENDSFVNTMNTSHVPKFKWKRNEVPHFISTLSDASSFEALESLYNIDDTDLDEAVKVFTGVLQRAAEPMSVKTRNRKQNSKLLQPKWWNNECAVLKTRKYDALKKFKLTNDNADLQAFKELRSEFKNMCKIKSSEWKNKLRARLIDCKSNPTEFWKTVKSVSKEYLQPSNLITPSEWFNYFERLLNQDVKIDEEFSDLVTGFTATHDAECGICNGHEQGSAELQDLNEPISEEEILKCIREMSNGKAAGVDGIVIEMLKCSSHITMPYLKHIYNRVLVTGVFPKQWCQAVLAPLHKKGAKSDLQGDCSIKCAGENIY